MIITSQEEFLALDPQDQANATPIFDPAETITPEGVAAYAAAWLREAHLNENQAVFSMMGMEGIIQPRLSDTNGRGRLIDTGDLQASAMLAGLAVNYLPNRQKIRPPDLSDTQWNMALHLLNQAAGGGEMRGGELIDIPLSNGIDLETPTGLGELEAELAGRESAFDAIKLEVSEEQYQGILAYVRTIKIGSREYLNKRIFQSWNETADSLFSQVLEHSVVSTALRAFVHSFSLDGAIGSPENERSRYISTLTDGFAAVVSTGRDAENAAASLRELLEAAKEVATDSVVHSAKPLTVVTEVSPVDWNARENRFHRALGVLVQYLVYSIGDATGAENALAQLREEVIALDDTGVARGKESANIYLAIGESIAWLLDDAPEPVRAALKRPDWMQR